MLFEKGKTGIHGSVVVASGGRVINRRIHDRDKVHDRDLGLRYSLFVEEGQPIDDNQRVQMAHEIVAAAQHMLDRIGAGGGLHLPTALDQQPIIRIGSNKSLAMLVEATAERVVFQQFGAHTHWLTTYVWEQPQTYEIVEGRWKGPRGLILALLAKPYHKWLPVTEWWGGDQDFLNAVIDSPYVAQGNGTYCDAAERLNRPEDANRHAARTDLPFGIRAHCAHAVTDITVLRQLLEDAHSRNWDAMDPAHKRGWLRGQVLLVYNRIVRLGLEHLFDDYRGACEVMECGTDTIPTDVSAAHRLASWRPNA